jgi:O-antigen ligase
MFWALTTLRHAKRHVWSHLYVKSFLLFSLLAALALFINAHQFSFSEVIISSLYLLRWLVYGGIFLVVRELSDKQKKSVFYLLYCSGFIVVILGFIQYFFYPNVRNIYYLGWDDHLYRLVSSILDPNFAAASICLIIFALFGRLLSVRSEHVKERMVLSLATLVTFIALLLTYSRSGYVMFLVGSVVFLLLAGKKKLIGLLAAVLVVGIILLPKDRHSAGVELLRTASISARSASAQQAIKIIADHPIAGVGFNTYRYVQKKYGFTAGANWQENHAGAGTDNSWLFVMATTGIFGLGAYIYFWYVLIYNSYNFYKYYKRYNLTKFQWMVALVVLSSIAGLFVDALFINSLFFPAILFWIWCLLGILQ